MVDAGKEPRTACGYCMPPGLHSNEEEQLLGVERTDDWLTDWRSLQLRFNSDILTLWLCLLYDFFIQEATELNWSWERVVKDANQFKVDS